MEDATERDWSAVYDLWFPASLIDAGPETIASMMAWWSGGNDAQKLDRFRPLVLAAREGRLERWRADVTGRLSLVVVLDQFTRGLHDGSPDAYAGDPQALQIALEGLENGDYGRLGSIWEEIFFVMPLVHAEGPDHLARLARVERLAAERLARAPDHLKSVCAFSLRQAKDNIEVISRFGRFPHRNPVLGRPSTSEEMDYLDKGKFVHRNTYEP